MISTVFLTNEHGKILLFRDYRGENTRYDACIFACNVIRQHSRPFKPVEQFGFATYCKVSLGCCCLVACCHGNSNAVLVLQWLMDIRKWISKILGSEFEERAILENACVIYELLDHAIDAGYPQDFYIHHLARVVPNKTIKNVFSKQNSVESNYLQDYGVDYGKQLKEEIVASYLNANLVMTSDPTLDKLQLEVPWRLCENKRRRNRIAVSLSECVQCYYSHVGEMLTSEITGAISLQCQLSGTPSVEIRLNTDFVRTTTPKVYKYMTNNNESEFDLPLGARMAACMLDFKVDKTVDIEAVGNWKVIRTVPAQGATILMIYRTVNTGQSPFEIKPIITKVTNNLLFYHVTLVTKYQNMNATDVMLEIPLLENTSSVDVIYLNGHCYPMLAFNYMHWIIGKASGGSIYTLEFQCKLYNSLTASKPTLGPIKLDFMLSHFSISGLYVRSVTIKNATHRTIKGVRYSTKSGNFHHKVRFPT